MAASDRVLVDTSVWIDFFRGATPAVNAMAWMTKTKRVVICGQIKQEVLQGSRDAKAFEKLEKQMSIWEYEAETPEDFSKAGRIFAGLRWKGITIPPRDCLIAALAWRLNLPLSASDPDFDSIPGISRLHFP
jgi:predicted nucleic acid-binding protein